MFLVFSCTDDILVPRGHIVLERSFTEMGLERSWIGGTGTRKNGGHS